MRDRPQRLTIEKLAVDCLDVRELNRAGLLKDRSVTFRPFLRPTIQTMSADRYVIQLNLRNQVVPQYIRLSWTPCNFGAFRPWLLYPFCETRVARLFKGMGGYFCRECVGSPIYESQLRNDMARVDLRAYRLRERIGGGRPAIDPVPRRPYRMWRSTYDRFVLKLNDWSNHS